MPIRAFVNPSHLSYIASGSVFALELEAPLVHTWVIYAIIGVLMVLLLWRVATQWKVKSQDAENLRITVLILVVRGGAMATWLFTHPTGNEARPREGPSQKITCPCPQEQNDQNTNCDIIGSSHQHCLPIEPMFSRQPFSLRDVSPVCVKSP